jgi:hypothetical protein
MNKKTYYASLLFFLPYEKYKSNPNPIHKKNQNQLIAGISIMRYKQQRAPMIGMNESFFKKARIDTTTSMIMKIKNNISW